MSFDFRFQIASVLAKWSLILIMANVGLCDERLRLKSNPPCPVPSYNSTSLSLDVLPENKDVFQLSGRIFSSEICKVFELKSYTLKLYIAKKEISSISCIALDSSNCGLEVKPLHTAFLRAFLVGEVQAELHLESNLIRSFTVEPVDEITNILEANINRQNFQGIVRLQSFQFKCPERITPIWAGLDNVTIEKLEVAKGSDGYCKYGKVQSGAALELEEAKEEEHHTQRHHQPLRFKKINLISPRTGERYEVGEFNDK